MLGEPFPPPVSNVHTTASGALHDTILITADLHLEAWLRERRDPL